MYTVWWILTCVYIHVTHHLNQDTDHIHYPKMFPGTPSYLLLQPQATTVLSFVTRQMTFSCRAFQSFNILRLLWMSKWRCCREGCILRFIWPWGPFVLHRISGSQKTLKKCFPALLSQLRYFPLRWCVSLSFERMCSSFKAQLKAELLCEIDPYPLLSLTSLIFTSLAAHILHNG